MICPECHQRFDDDSGFCPRCGVQKGIVKTSTILISAGQVESVYRSVEEVPDPLRGQLLRSTNGLNSATIVIADRQGRKEIAKAIRHLPAPAQAKPAEPTPTAKAGLRPAILHVVGGLLLLIALGVVWLLFRRT
jgi:hypothetical protein